MNAGRDAAWLDDEPIPQAFSRGPWSFVVRGDSIDDICFAGSPVLRAIRFVIRDHDWRTVSSVCAVSCHDEGESVVLRLNARTDDETVRLSWTARLVLTGSELTFDVVATAENTFLRNRIGVIVLHRPELAGMPFTVRNPAGLVAHRVFPLVISPHQPATDIAELSWSDEGLDADLWFTGEVFEMEDQRNWTDASFKTYSTPLSRPFPVAMRAGDTVRQSVRLRCRQRHHRSRSDAPPRTVHLSVPVGVFPEILLGASTAAESGQPAGTPHTAGPLLVELDLNSGNWRAALERAARDADGEGLDARLITSDVAPIGTAVAALADHRLIRVGVFDSLTHLAEPALCAALAAALTESGLDVPLVTGTRAHFTELNRNRAPFEKALLPVTFSITPEMHDRGRRQVIESIPMQRLIAERAAQVAAGSPVHIGPITLGPRFNAVATSQPTPDVAVGIAGGYGAEQVTDATDPRQSSPAVAVWLIASATALTVPGVASLSYFEAWGPRGVRATDGTAFPAATAVRWLRSIVGWQVLAADVPRGAPTVLVVCSSDQVVVLAANVEADRRSVRIRFPGLPASLGCASISGPGGEPVAELAADLLTIEVPPAGAVRWQGRTQKNVSARR